MYGDRPASMALATITPEAAAQRLRNLGMKISGETMRAAHRCRETAQALHEYGQRMAMERMGWSTADFVREFGRNYLDEANAQQLRGENPSPHQSAARTASPQGEAMGAAEAPPEGKARGGAGAAATVSLQGEAVGGGIGFEVTDFELCVNW